jgi:outer membrane protein assembly factor BamB
MKRFRLLSAALATVLLTGSAVRADEWSRFRGPNGNGVAGGNFSAEVSEKDIAWKADLPGKGHASPVIWGDRIFLTSADAEEGKRWVLCLNAADGSVRWKKEYAFEKYKQHADNSFASATPAVDADAVYIAWSSPERYTLMALSHEGNELWSQDLGGFRSVQGSGASPVLFDDAVIIPNDQEGPKSSLMAYDRKSGAVLWSLERKSGDKTAMSTPVVFRAKDRPPVLVFTSKASGMTAVDPKTGIVQWEAPGLFDARTVGSPVATDEMVLGACGEGAAHRVLVAVKPGKSAEEPTVAYTIKGIAPYVPTPVVKGDRLYLWADNSTVTCCELATGKTLWSEKAGGLYYGSPVLVGDTLWCLSRKGELVGVRAGEKFEKVAKLELGEPSHSTPAVAGDRMFLRTVSKLVCLKLKPAK